MARGSRSGKGGGRIGGHSTPPIPPPPFFRTPEERRRWVASEGVRKRATRRWTNRELTPPPKLARYADYGEGNSRGGGHPWSSSPLNSSGDSSDDDDVTAMVIDSDDYAHDDEQEEAAIQRATVLSVAEAHTAWTREEADLVHQVWAYEAARKEVAVRCVKRPEPPLLGRRANRPR